MKNIYAVLIGLMPVMAQAQEKPQTGWTWRFFTGIETQTLGIETLDGKEPDQTAVYSERNLAGVTAGFQGLKNIYKGISFRTGLSLSYNHNRVEFRPGGSRSYTFTDLELPVYLHYVYQKDPAAALRGALLFGARLGWNMASSDGQPLLFLRERMGIDLGLGLEIGKGKWRWSPEVVYSHGINNIHDFDNNSVDLLVGRAVRDKLAFRVVVFRAK